MNKYYKLSLVFVSFYCIYGCTIFRPYPPVQKGLFSWQVPKEKVEVVKDTISSNGYERITRDNYPYEGAIVTQYAKEISTSEVKSRVLIMLSFKETCIVHRKTLGIQFSTEERCITDDPFYRNLGINISNLDRDDLPEINDEVNRIEEALYKKLLEVAGENNVVRGKRRVRRK